VRFVEVYLATPVSVCAQRDPKGLYARASEGEITSFTGLDHPYEPPTEPDVVVGHHLPLEEAVEAVLLALGSADRPNRT
jgi:adenylylsulfate kinase-like enzyme